MNDISMNDDLCFPYFPSFLSLSLFYPSSFLLFSPLARHTACCTAHGITADRSLFDQLVMLFLLKIGGREIGGASIRTGDPPSDSNYFSFYSFSLSVHTQHRRNLCFPFGRLYTRRRIELCKRVMTFSAASDPLTIFFETNRNARKNLPFE